MQAGSEATSAILERANQAVDKEARIAAVEDLQGRVDDWKGHQLERFGELIINGTQTVLKGEAPKEVEREVSTGLCLLSRLFFRGMMFTFYSFSTITYLRGYNPQWTLVTSYRIEAYSEHIAPATI